VIGAPEPDEHDELLARLKAIAARVDPVPPHVLAAARASATWQTIDAELAMLVYDSVVDGELVGVRGGGARQLTFESAEASLEVEVAAGPRRLNGQLVPPREADIEVRHPGGSFTVRSDVLGHFKVDILPAGPVSFGFQAGGPGSHATHTDWVLL
jgi:hypothetical protein